MPRSHLSAWCVITCIRAPHPIQAGGNDSMSIYTHIVIRLFDKVYGLSNNMIHHNSMAVKHGLGYQIRPRFCSRCD